MCPHQKKIFATNPVPYLVKVILYSAVHIFYVFAKAAQKATPV